jgi:heme/copper-type cytochrome/quinol oxidase subunit 2
MNSLTATVLFWGAAACCVVSQLALVWSAIRAPMPGSSESAVKMPRRASEIAWTILPTLALATLLIFTWRATRVAAF